jgi:hypothetical protein
VLYDGVAKVVDFGVAYSDGAQDRAGLFAGKRPYMSPEQLLMQPIDRRSDLWSLGVVLWEATVGQRLFRRDSDDATEEAILRESIPGPRVYRGDYPRELEAVVMKALARDPSQRYQTAAELARALEGYLASTGTPAGVDEVRAVMQEYFGDRMAAREMQIRARSQDAFGAIPEGESTHAAGAPTTRLDVAAPRLGKNKPKEVSTFRNVLGWIVTLALVAGMVGGGVYFVWTMPDVKPRPPVDPRVIPLVEAGDNDASEREHNGRRAPPASDAAAAPRVLTPSIVPVRRAPANAGYLTITGGRRGGYVSEGGFQLGALPLQHFPLAPGRHLIRVETGPGDVTRTLIVNIQTGGEVVQRYPEPR